MSKDELVILMSMPTNKKGIDLVVLEKLSRFAKIETRIVSPDKYMYVVSIDELLHNNVSLDVIMEMRNNGWSVSDDHNFLTNFF